MPELFATLEEFSRKDFEDKKFLASLQGADIGGDEAPENKWEEIKARAYSNGATSNPRDILALQGVAAKKAGFGIGMGLDYEVID
jgi:hypothetical protein